MIRSVAGSSRFWPTACSGESAAASPAQSAGSSLITALRSQLATPSAAASPTRAAAVHHGHHGEAGLTLLMQQFSNDANGSSAAGTPLNTAA